MQHATNAGTLGKGAGRVSPCGVRRFEVLGVNDDESTCQCCGKEGLARVVWIEDNETGEILHFGTTCAKAPAKGFQLDKQINAAVRAHDKALAEIERKAYWAKVEADTREKLATVEALYLAAMGGYRQHVCSNGLVLTIPDNQPLRDACHWLAFGA